VLITLKNIILIKKEYNGGERVNTTQNLKAELTPASALNGRFTKIDKKKEKKRIP